MRNGRTTVLHYCKGVQCNNRLTRPHQNDFHGRLLSKLFVFLRHSKPLTSLTPTSSCRSLTYRRLLHRTQRRNGLRSGGTMKLLAILYASMLMDLTAVAHKKGRYVQERLLQVFSILRVVGSFWEPLAVRLKQLQVLTQQSCTVLLLPTSSSMMCSSCIS